jgi:hypothetical protein
VWKKTPRSFAENKPLTGMKIVSLDYPLTGAFLAMIAAWKSGPLTKGSLPLFEPK